MTELMLKLAAFLAMVIDLSLIHICLKEGGDPMPQLTAREITAYACKADKKQMCIRDSICTARLCICCKMTKIMELIPMSNPIVTIEMENGGVIRAEPVSYTHLDVYKRQHRISARHLLMRFTRRARVQSCCTMRRPCLKPVRMTSATKSSLCSRRTTRALPESSSGTARPMKPRARCV